MMYVNFSLVFCCIVFLNIGGFFLYNDVIKMEGCLWFLMLNVDLKEIFFMEFIFLLKMVKKEKCIDFICS